MLETQRAVRTARMRAELFKYPWWDFFLPSKANRHNIMQSLSFLLHHPWHLHLYGSKISFCKAQLDYVLNLQEQLEANCSCICWYNTVKLSQVNWINKNGDKWASLWLLLGVPGLLVWWGLPAHTCWGSAQLTSQEVKPQTQCIKTTWGAKTTRVLFQEHWPS